MTIYIFMALSFLIGLLVLFRMGKEDRFYCLLGIGLILLSAWLLGNKLLNGLLSSGWYAWAGRGVLIVIGGYLCFLIYQEEKKKSCASAPANQPSDALLDIPEETLTPSEEEIDENTKDK